MCIPRVQQQTVHLSHEDLLKQKQEAEQEKMNRTVQARERKQRMQQLEEERRLKKPELSDVELEAQRAQAALAAEAQRVIDEQRDQV